MNEEEKKATEELKKDLLIHECWEANNLDKIFKISHLHSLRVVLNLIEKQEKVIDEMAKVLAIPPNYPVMFKKNDEEKLKEDVKQYFYRKVDNNEN